MSCVGMLSCHVRLVVSAVREHVHWVTSLSNTWLLPCSLLPRFDLYAQTLLDNRRGFVEFSCDTQTSLLTIE